MPENQKKLVLDTNIIRYLWYNDNVNYSSRDFLEKRISILFNDFCGNIYLPKIVQIELEYFLKKEGKDVNEIKNLLDYFKLLKIDEKSFYILKSIEYLLRDKKKYNLSDFLILASIISNFSDRSGNLNYDITLLTADVKDFEIGLLKDIFESVSFRNICYVLQEKQFVDTKKYQAINLYAISFSKITEDFKSIGKGIWWIEDISF